MDKATEYKNNLTEYRENMDKATPRPWRYGIGFTGFCINSEAESIAVTMDKTDFAEANAELIVKAVNRDALFDELLTMAEAYYKLVRHNSTKEALTEMQAILERAKAAK